MEDESTPVKEKDSFKILWRSSSLFGRVSPLEAFISVKKLNGIRAASADASRFETLGSGDQTVDLELDGVGILKEAKRKGGEEAAKVAFMAAFEGDERR